MNTIQKRHDETEKPTKTNVYRLLVDYSVIPVPYSLLWADKLILKLTDKTAVLVIFLHLYYTTIYRLLSTLFRSDTQIDMTERLMFSALLCSDLAVRSAAELYPGCYILCLFSLILGKSYFDFHYITSLSVRYMYVRISLHKSFLARFILLGAGVCKTLSSAFCGVLKLFIKSVMFIMRFSPFCYSSSLQPALLPFLL